MNKKLIYLSIFLVIAIFLISACQDIVGARIKSSGEAQPIDKSKSSGNDVYANNVYVREKLMGGIGTDGKYSVILKNNGIETNQITVSGETNTRTVFATEHIDVGGARLSLNKDEKVLIFSMQGTEDGNFMFGGDLIVNRNARTTGDLLVGDEATVGNLRIIDEQGDGNAYLCINSLGVVFRSNDPCR